MEFLSAAAAVAVAIWLSVSLSVCLFVCRSVRLLVCLSANKSLLQLQWRPKWCQSGMQGARAAVGSRVRLSDWLTEEGRSFLCVCVCVCVCLGVRACNWAYLCINTFEFEKSKAKHDGNNEACILYIDTTVSRSIYCMYDESVQLSLYSWHSLWSSTEASDMNKKLVAYIFFDLLIMNIYIGTYIYL